MTYKHTRFPRAACPGCHTIVPAMVPSHGDGSVWVYRKHRNADGETCSMSRRDVESSAVTSEGSGWGSRG